MFSPAVDNLVAQLTRLPGIGTRTAQRLAFHLLRVPEEEALALAEADVPFEVVPGVSALSAVPAAAGIPVTHRGVASQVTIAAGHDLDALDWPALARTPGTLVFFMALGSLPELARRLMSAGRTADTPAAVISNGTLPDQTAVTAPLSEIAEAAAAIEPPALIVVGDVVSVAAVLAPEQGIVSAAT
jgi:uroporphyrin-III C-methyltransferase/precorrin-2 dehydrogenase/sirohydrochlorin ferrochelatase